MTKDTTFKEFVEEKGITFTRLVYDSDEYRELARQFNEAKLELTSQDAEAASRQKNRGAQRSGSG